MKQELIDFYHEYGYVVIRNVVEPELLDQQLQNIYQLLLRFYEVSEELKQIERPWSSLLFHEEIINFRKRDKHLFSGFYDSIQSSVALTRIVTSKELIRCVAELSGLEPCEISSMQQQVRVDVPYDKQNALQWHQDWSYFPANHFGLTSMVCWLPLVEPNDHIGLPQVYAKSHKEGAAARLSEKMDLVENLPKEKNYEFIVSEQIPVNNDTDLEQYQNQSIKLNLGDVLFFSIFLFHRSGINSSNMVRFSCQNRFHGATSQDFVPFRLVSKSNPYVERLVEERKRFYLSRS